MSANTSVTDGAIDTIDGLTDVLTSAAVSAHEYVIVDKKRHSISMVAFIHSQRQLTETMLVVLVISDSPAENFPFLLTV